MAERFDRHRTGIAIAVLVAVVLLGMAALFVPWLTRQREAISATPVRKELVAPTTVALSAGQRACLDGVSFDPDAQVAEVTIATAATAAARLSLTTAAGGYRARSIAHVAPGQAGPVAIPLAPPRRSAIGTLCLRDAGRSAVSLAGTVHPWALVRPKMTLDGQPVAEAFSLTLREAGQRSLLDRVPQLADRAAALSAVGPWLFWLLIPLLLVGAPVGVIAAFWLALRERA